MMRGALSLYVLVLSAWTNSAVADDKLFATIPSEANGVVLTNARARLLTDNLRAAYENIAILRSAGRGDTVFLSTYQLRADIFGRATLYEAILARRRGAAVVLDVDGYDLVKADRRLMVMAAIREGCVALAYQPLELRRLLHWNERLHEKSVMVLYANGKLWGKWGGRNQSDHYHLGDGVFDVDVSFKVSDVSQARSLWNAQVVSLLNDPANVPFENAYSMASFDEAAYAAEMIEFEKMRALVNYFFEHDLAKHPEHAEVTVERAVFLRNVPGKPDLTRAMENMVKVAEKGATIINAYFIPDQEFRETITGKLKSGVRVSLVTNSRESTSPDTVVRLMEWTTEKLLGQGLSLYLRREGEMHGKATVVDTSLVTIGSNNHDPRGEKSDTQSGFVFDSPPIALQLENVLAASIVRGEYENVEDFSKHAGVLSWCSKVLLLPTIGKH